MERKNSLREAISGLALIRFEGTSIFKSSHPVLKESIDRIERNNGHEEIFQKIFDNRRVGTTLVFTQGFLSHLNPTWLMTNSGSENFKIPDLGMFAIPEGMLILLGLWWMQNK